MAVEPNRWGIIYNPKAGSRKTQKRWNEIRSYMENRKVVLTTYSPKVLGRWNDSPVPWLIMVIELL